jgi:murein DD-endopeptidase MepM/ murein hydrolase activator NlpD
MRSFVPFAMVVALFGATHAASPAPAPAPASSAWTWPVVGPVIQGFDPPQNPFGSGHRGIDIAAPVGTSIVAPADGTVTFAGPVGGRLFLTIDHGGGLESTSSWLSALLVHKGDTVVQGQPVALTGWGHPNAPIPHLHFGVKLDDAYVDPLEYLGTAPVTGMIRLAPLG